MALEKPANDRRLASRPVGLRAVLLLDLGDVGHDLGALDQQILDPIVNRIDSATQFSETIVGHVHRDYSVVKRAKILVGSVVKSKEKR